MSTVKPEKAEKVMDSLEKVVVAVKAAKMIPRTALVWALTHVVRPGTCILLLVVVPSHSSGRKLWGFPRFAGDCANGHRKLGSGTTQEQKTEISDSCSQMMLQLQDVYGPTKINIKVKIISGSPSGAVAAESRLAQANWVVLDRHLKQEEKRCVEELQCNIVVIKRSQPKVLRLNLVASAEMEPKVLGPLPHLIDESSAKNSLNGDPQSSIQVPNATPTSSPEVGTPFSATEVGASSISSSDPATSPLVLAEAKDLGFKKEEATTENESQNSDTCSSDSESEDLMTPSTLEFQSWVVEKLSKKLCPKEAVEISQRHNNNAPNSIFRALLDKFSLLDNEAGINNFSHSAVSDLSSNVREKILASRNASPPLCSICQHKAPVFGKPPRLFSYAELELATGGFSQANFLAEGGFGSVHRGILPDGQVVAIKQHKLASSQGDVEFCSEVEVLSCAQHRNVVMLVGFCVEDKRRLLVYEYICNGSLDSHLYGCTREPLQWPARQKIAVGAARGLRYLHEECRVGCIVHRDLRPNNILVTHDFEAMVGDFGLARWQPDGDMGAETRVVGTFGYLAPEYAQSGQITEKTDVFSFGVVLVELVTGKKALDINRPKGQQCLTEWARPLLEENAVDELIDPRLKNDYSNSEVSCMLHAASLCIRRDGKARPRMSQILRILEGGMVL